MNEIKSALGTVTWIDPEYYISYNNETGEILSIGSPDLHYQILKIEKKLAVEFIDGNLDKLKYRVVQQGDQVVVKKTETSSLVFKTYPILIKETYFPLAKIIRNKNVKQWVIEKSIKDPIFFFVFEKNTDNYIRTLSVVDKNTVVNFIFDSECCDVDIKVNEKYKEINFKDE